MPWIALVCLGLVVGGCSFEADYSGATVRCEIDRKCPTGLECREDMDFTCQKLRMDAAVDMPRDMMMMDGDAPPNSELSCAVPGMLQSTGGTASDSTTNRTNKVQPTCNSTPMFGFDAVYRITPGAGKQMTVTIAGFSSVTAYVVTTCPMTTCLANMFATAGNSLVVTTVTGPQYVVVDSNLAAGFGNYNLTVTVN